MLLKDLPDHLLLEKCQYDDQLAYNVLFKRYFKSIYNYTHKHTRDEDLAEELAMDVMFRLWQKRASLDPDINLSAYLFKSIKNALIDHWRKKELLTVDLTEAESIHFSRPADYQLRSREMQDVYHKTVDTLSPQSRLIFKLSREQEMTYPEIAKEMGISVNTVKGHMIAALKGMRLKLGYYF